MSTDEWSSSFDLSGQHEEYVLALSRIGVFASSLSIDYDCQAEALLQHSMKEGLFGILIRLTWPSGRITHVGSKSKDPLTALQDAAVALDELLLRLDENSWAEDEQKARSKRSSRRKRVRAEGKRGNGVRKGRRKVKG